MFFSSVLGLRYDPFVTDTDPTTVTGALTS
jgi:hypothetical protein